MLVKLVQPFEFNNVVGSICMAESDVREEKEEEGVQCVNAGWTDASKGGNNISEDKCRRKFGYSMGYIS